MPSDNQDIQDIHPDSTRVYMDELPGTVQSFTGNKLTLVSSSLPYTFDVSQATLESEDGIIRGDSVSVIYEGQLTDTDTSTVRALKVVDDYHTTDTLKDKTSHGQIQQLTANSVTIKSRGGKTATFPITGAEQYYQNGLKTGTIGFIFTTKANWRPPIRKTPPDYTVLMSKCSVSLILILLRFLTRRQLLHLPKIRSVKRRTSCVL